MKTKDTQTVAVSSRRPPVIAVLGHVDHGKTTLLDYLRKTNVTAQEYGGITQHIGAYQITLPSEKKKESASEFGNTLTFIDTPGHEAFIKMRSRGAKVADIAILVIAADDSVKPQTVESIRVIQEARIPMIVALNKMDLPGANAERVKKDLAKNGVQVEGFGGDVPIVPISAKTGKGVTQLLDMILLVCEVKDIPKPSDGLMSGVVIETRVDKGKGMVATVIILQGYIRIGDPLYEGSKQVAKVRAMFDEHAKNAAEAPAGKPVEILGFNSLPAVGASLTTSAGEYTGHAVHSAGVKQTNNTLPDYLQPIDATQGNKLKVILKADTAGSLEAITESLGDRITVIGSGVGDITEADILQAKATGAFVVGFQVKASGSVSKLALTEKVIFRTYSIIYELLDELAEVIEGQKTGDLGERELGSGQIIAEFPFENLRIAGTKVTSGRLARGDSVKIMRADDEIGRGKIKSLRIGKEDTSKVAGGNECGVLLDKKLDFKPGDGIIAFTTG